MVNPLSQSISQFRRAEDDSYNSRLRREKNEEHREDKEEKIEDRSWISKRIHDAINLGTELALYNAASPSKALNLLAIGGSMALGPEALLAEDGIGAGVRYVVGKELPKIADKDIAVNLKRDALRDLGRIQSHINTRVESARKLMNIRNSRLLYGKGGYYRRMTGELQDQEYNNMFRNHMNNWWSKVHDIFGPEYSDISRSGATFPRSHGRDMGVNPLGNEYRDALNALDSGRIHSIKDLNDELSEHGLTVNVPSSGGSVSTVSTSMPSLVYDDEDVGIPNQIPGNSNSGSWQDDIGSYVSRGRDPGSIARSQAFNRRLDDAINYFGGPSSSSMNNDDEYDEYLERRINPRRRRLGSRVDGLIGVYDRRGYPNPNDGYYYNS